jgi:hypothetical protein
MLWKSGKSPAKRTGSVNDQTVFRVLSLFQTFLPDCRSTWFPGIAFVRIFHGPGLYEIAVHAGLTAPAPADGSKRIPDRVNGVSNPGRPSGSVSASGRLFPMLSNGSGADVAGWVQHPSDVLSSDDAGNPPSMLPAHADKRKEHADQASNRSYNVLNDTSTRSMSATTNRGRKRYPLQYRE